MTRLLCRLLLVFAFAAPALTMGAQSMAAEDLDPENTLIMKLETGEVIIRMRPDLAPNHVARIKELVRQDFYDGLTFHRVIGGFMAQTGDPRGDGTGGSGQNLEAEFSDEPFVRGTLGMARSGHPDSADSQFFIMFARQSHLDGQYTVWGEVVDGMVHVGKIKRGDPNRNGEVRGPDKILQLEVMADVKQ